MVVSKEEVKLLGIVGSPFVTRVELALKLKGIEYEYVHETWTTKSDMLVKYNPVHKKVPVLVHNDKGISESIVIIEYIDEAWKGYSILPSDPYQRALSRFWYKFIDEKVQPTIFKAAFDPDAKEREKGVEELLGNLQILENELKHNKFFLGDSFGLVDIPGAFIAYWLPTIIEAGEGQFLSDFTADKFPKIHKWSHEILNHPVIKEALPPRQLLVGFGKSKFASIAAAST